MTSCSGQRWVLPTHALPCPLCRRISRTVAALRGNRGVRTRTSSAYRSCAGTTIWPSSALAEVTTSEQETVIDSAQQRPIHLAEFVPVSLLDDLGPIDDFVHVHPIGAHSLLDQRGDSIRRAEP